LKDRVDDDVDDDDDEDDDWKNGFDEKKVTKVAPRCRRWESCDIQRLVVVVVVRVETKKAKERRPASMTTSSRNKYRAIDREQAQLIPAAVVYRAEWSE
jgi:hypothetical protein